MQRRKGRVRFDSELIKREMFGGLVDRSREFGAPRFGGLAGPRIDQVERKVGSVPFGPVR